MQTFSQGASFMFLRRKRFWLITSTLIGACAVIVALDIVSFWKSPFPIRFSKDELDGLSKISEYVESIRQEQAAGRLPWRLADYSTVGFPEKEAKLQRLRNEVTFFEITFRRPPTTLWELTALFQAWPALRSAREKDYIEFARECEIFSSAFDDAYVLNCDGWRPGGLGSVNKLMRTFEPDTEKFYSVNGHVLLYVPAWVHGRPMPSNPSRGAP